MKDNILKHTAQRRGFLRDVATGAAAIGITAVASSFKFITQQDKAGSIKLLNAKDPADVWFDKVKGTHRVVFDSTEPNQIMPFVWPRIFLVTNAATGSPESDCGVVVVLRHESIGYAFNDKVWAKYNFGEVFKAADPGPAWQVPDAKTAGKTRNPFYMSKLGDFAAPGFGAVPISIPELQESGVMFCVCNAAMTVYSNVLAGQMNMKAEDVMNEWKANLIPGIQIVPSGVWAVGRAQEHGCQYIFAG